MRLTVMTKEVEAWVAGGRRKRRNATGLPLKMMRSPPTAVSREKIPKMIRKPRYGGPGMGVVSSRRKRKVRLPSTVLLRFASGQLLRILHSHQTVLRD